MKKYIIGFSIILLMGISLLIWRGNYGEPIQFVPSNVKQHSSSVDGTTIRRPSWKEIDEQEARVRTLPIKFWGRVLDQNNQPVSGASVRVSIMYVDITQSYGSGESWLDLQTDANGDFRVSKKIGYILSVDEIKKDGYVLSGRFFGMRTFTYYNSSPKDCYKYDPNNPVIFRMWKKQDGGEKLIKGGGFYGIRPDGRIYTFDLLQNNKTEGKGNGDIRISIKRPEKVNNYDKFDWEINLEAVDGGIVDTIDEFLYLAPETGYKPKLEYRQSVASPDWSARLNKKFYLKSRNGKIYASLEVKVISNYDEDAVFDVKYYANSFGSRNLEH